MNQGLQSPSFSKFINYFTSANRNAFIQSFECPVQNILTSGWNNAPRYRERSTEIVQAPNYDQFKETVTIARQNKAVSSQLPLMCNAWNEWSEGAAIEPCVYLGDQLLRAYVEN